MYDGLDAVGVDQQVGNICLIFMLSSYIYAAVGVEIYGKLECSDDYPCLGLHAEANFRHFGVALITLYGLCTGDNWNMIMKDTLRECHPDEHGCMSYLSWVSPCTTNHQFRGYGPVCAGELGGRINHASAGGRQRGSSSTPGSIRPRTSTPGPSCAATTAGSTAT
ncbi:voltage-dependent T-type calcium channel subunit alpha-1I-like [Micropterus salmoides]|uniref:voltage-dependent T-type calcium channel subunit alpha-1I-like n=1 Tax=Micropterus salmoides TaxID=27706 RepID=UPI0018ECEDB5|nr:voltage-dependent T-type calcium channel subunit alpha-1I-like [Micropterus salmoides]